MWFLLHLVTPIMSFSLRFFAKNTTQYSNIGRLFSIYYSYRPNCINSSQYSKLLLRPFTISIGLKKYESSRSLLCTLRRILRKLKVPRKKCKQPNKRALKAGYLHWCHFCYPLKRQIIVLRTTTCTKKVNKNVRLPIVNHMIVRLEPRKKKVC